MMRSVSISRFLGLSPLASWSLVGKWGLAVLLIGQSLLSAAAFQPDPAAIQTYGPGYRYPQNGWIVVHIEGSPYERGQQHGRLLAPEIAAYVRCLAACYGSKAPAESWNLIRQLTGALMLRHYPAELLEEMQGIADGATAAGARVEGRGLDVTDIAAINAANELDLLEEALKATPTGLETLNLPEKKPIVPVRNSQPQKRPRPTRCSAFAANGSATKDGKIIFGHITMYDLYQSNHYNVWLDVKPTKGHRFVMQTTPGGIHSSMDFAINDAGILLAETTIQQTACDSSGIPLAVRIRNATQYAESIETAAEFLSKNGNGLSSTEWILADINRNEIALLSLGLKQQVLHRSSKNEWIGGTDGFYWSCNNTKDTAVRLETVPGMRNRPTDAAVFEPSKRDAVWLKLYEEHKGKMTEDFARTVLTTPALVSASSADAVYTTSDLAAQLKAWGSFGPPVNGIREPSMTERTHFPEIMPLISNPWTVLENAPPTPLAKASETHVQDLHDPLNPLDREIPPPQRREHEPETQPAWRGTLLPATDADLWLVLAFADYERFVALENLLKKKAPENKLGPEQFEDLGVELNFYKTVYHLGTLADRDLPLTKLRQNFGNENWYRIASGKGVLLLHHLRGLIGPQKFDPLMQSFGLEYAGKAVTSEAFRTHLETGCGRSLQEFFRGWLEEPGLPFPRLVQTEIKHAGKSWITRVVVQRDKGSAVAVVPLTVEDINGEEVTVLTPLEGLRATVEIPTEEKPSQVTLDKYGLGGFETGTPFSILSFEAELEDSLIVYGTVSDAVANAESARALQVALRRREHNITVPFKADSDVSERELKNKHILLIGRPATNRIAQQTAAHLPVSFGSQSFEIRGDTFAHPESAVITSAENPFNPRYSMVLVAGLSAIGTYRAVPIFEEDSLSYAHTVVLGHHRIPHATTLPPEQSIRKLP